MYTYYNDFFDRSNFNSHGNGGIYDKRFGGFLVPFLLGGLGGAAVVGAYNRPRPIPGPYYYAPGYYNQGYYQGYYPYGY